MRTAPRPRKQISPSRLRWLSPVVRYSASRDAYVLRGVGSQLGPVYKVVAGTESGEANAADSASHPAT